MRAAVVNKAGDAPTVQDFAPPDLVRDGETLIHVTTAGLGGWDVVGAYRLPTRYPAVVRGEGVGRAEDGRRVYFGERSVPPFGAWANQTVVPTEEVWDVPDDIDDGLAIALAIAGTGAVVPLEQANIRKGENVLILGASGTLGQIALQLARRLGAGRVVAAGRDERALLRLAERGLADRTAKIGTADDEGALKAAAGDGYDVVLDVVYGPPFVAALRATAFGARIMSVGAQAGLSAQVSLPDMLFRTHTCVGTGQRSPQDRREIWTRLLGLAREQEFVIDYARFTLEQAADAWAAQAASPHAKVLGLVGG